MIVYNNNADLEVSDTCIRNSLLSWVEEAEKIKARKMNVIVHGVGESNDSSPEARQARDDKVLVELLH